MSAFDPDEDEWGAQRRDLHRLDDILRPRIPADADPGDLAAAVPHLTESELAEVTGLLTRLGLTEDPETTRARQRTLLDYARIEAGLLAILAEGQPRHRGGKILTDPATGKPLRNRNTDRQARALLRRIGHDRARVTGQPPAADST